ncbi:hypothetical protein [Altericista sp. CCNU0014]|uniref:hypothetical protein n=1 Tax=Altericista sp. CCNU0014 TaxID=3082949 RepID=UPI00384D6E09
MNPKRSPSPKKEKKTSTPSNKAAQASSLQDVSISSDVLHPPSAEDSDREKAAPIAEPSKVRRIEGYEADWQRWDQLAQMLGDKKQSQALLFRYLMQMAESQGPEAGQDLRSEPSPSPHENPQFKEDALAELMTHIPQLLSAMTSLTVQFQQNQQQQQQLNLLLSQVLQALAGNGGSESFAALRQSGRKANGTAAIAKGSFATLESKELKKSHAKGSAEEKLKRTFEAIVSYNEAAERTHADKWAINQNALAELTGCNRPAIKQFLKEYAAEIERHHQAHGLLPRHNYAHGKLGIKIADIISW